MSENLTVEDATALITDALQGVAAHTHEEKLALLNEIANLKESVKTLRASIKTLTTANNTLTEANATLAERRDQLTADLAAMQRARNNRNRAAVNAMNQTVVSNRFKGETFEALKLLAQTMSHCLGSPTAVGNNRVVQFAHLVWKPYTFRTRYDAEHRESIRDQFFKGLELVISQPLTLLEKNQICLGERPYEDGPGHRQV